jgi:hypothetical protein
MKKSLLVLGAASISFLLAFGFEGAAYYQSPSSSSYYKTCRIIYKNGLSPKTSDLSVFSDDFFSEAGKRFLENGVIDSSERSQVDSNIKKALVYWLVEDASSGFNGISLKFTANKAASCITGIQLLAGLTVEKLGVMYGSEDDFGLWLYDTNTAFSSRDLSSYQILSFCFATFAISCFFCFTLISEKENKWNFLYCL